MPGATDIGLSLTVKVRTTSNAGTDVQRPESFFGQSRVIRALEKSSRRRRTTGGGSRRIENGTHQRLDVMLNDDRCRVRTDNGLLVPGLFRRLAISLFMHWRLR